MFFSEEKNQKTFVPLARANIRDLAGEKKISVSLDHS